MAARAGAWTSDDLLERALTAAGGRERLSRVKALNWYGTVSFGDAPPTLSVHTRCEPFRRVVARTDILAASSRFNERTKVFDAKGGTIAGMDNKPKPLPRAEALHEHHQFGLYGYMLLAQASTREEAGRLVAEHPGYPPIRFDVAPDGRLVGADYRVASTDGKSVDDQRFVFEGRVSDKGINWPARMTIMHGGNAYLSIHFLTFSVELN